MPKNVHSLVLRTCDSHLSEEEGSSDLTPFSVANKFIKDGNGHGDSCFVSNY